MIKEFLKRSLMMFFYASGASFISTFIIISLFYGEGNDIYWAFGPTVQFAIMGMIASSPILLLSAGWFWHARNKGSFLYWAVTPVLLSLTLSLISFWVMNEALEGTIGVENWITIAQFAFAFSFAGLQTAFYMWLTYSKFRKSEIETPIISQPTMEVQNARN